VALREDFPAAGLAEALDQLQGQLINRCAGRGGCPSGAWRRRSPVLAAGRWEDFARKGRRSGPRRIDTAARTEPRLWQVGCHGCGRVFAPLLIMLGLGGQRRTDRPMVDLAELGTQMSFARAARVAKGFGAPGAPNRVHHALADVAGFLTGQTGALGPGGSPQVVLSARTGERQR